MVENNDTLSSPRLWALDPELPTCNPDEVPAQYLACSIPELWAPDANLFEDAFSPDIFESAKDREHFTEHSQMNLQCLEKMSHSELLQQVRSTSRIFRTMNDLVQSNPSITSDCELPFPPSEYSLDHATMAMADNDSQQHESAGDGFTQITTMEYRDSPNKFKEQSSQATDGSEYSVNLKSQGKPSKRSKQLSATSNLSLRRQSLRQHFSLNSSEASDILTLIGGLSLSSKDTEDTAAHPTQYGNTKNRFSIGDMAEDGPLFPCDVFAPYDHITDYKLYEHYEPLNEGNYQDLLQRVTHYRTAQELSVAASRFLKSPYSNIFLENWHLLDIDGQSRDYAGNTPLHIAAACGAGYRCLRDLMRKSSLNALNNSNRTFMHVLNPSTLVIQQDFASFLFDLLITDYDFKQRDDRGSNMLQNLLKAKCLVSYNACMQLFDGLAIDVLDLTSRDATGLSALSRLAALIKSDPKLRSCTNVDEGGLADLECTQFLYQMNRLAGKKEPAGTYTIKAIIDQYDAQETSQSPNYVNFHHATYITEEAFASRVGSILASGTDSAQSEDDYGRNALHLLAYTLPDRGVSATRRFANDSNNRRKRHELYERRAKQITILILQGVSLHTYDKQGQTPLLAMITRLEIHDDDVARSKLVDLLLKSGANVNCRGRHDETPLHEAVERGFISTTGALLRYGAKPNAYKAGRLAVVNQAILTAQSLKASSKSPQARHRTKNLHLRILMCIEKVMTHGGVAFPTLEHQ